MLTLLLLSITLIIVHINAIKQEDFYNCRLNNDACLSTDCSALSTLQRSGFICDDFPYFTGGLQLQFIQYGTYWDHYTEHISHCLHQQSLSNLSSIPCTEWQTSSTTQSNINQTCICDSDNTTFGCSTWKCHSSENIQNNNYEMAISECNCSDYEHDICVKWTCFELYHPQYSNQISMNETIDKSFVFNASYSCISEKAVQFINQTTKNSSSICWKWSAQKTNQDEWKVTSCECSNSVCSIWSCYERSFEYYYITPQQFHIGWISITVLGSIVLMCATAKLQNPRNNDRSSINKCCVYFVVYALSIISAISLLTLCFIISGLAGVIIACGIWICSAFIICPLCKWLFIKRYESYWGSDARSDDELGSTSNIYTTRRGQKRKTAVYDFWKGTSREKKHSEKWNHDHSHLAYEYEPYDPI